jgi:hypothetical protein
MYKHSKHTFVCQFHGFSIKEYICLPQNNEEYDES